MKNYINEKVIFKYNLMGLVLEGFVISEINVATGVMIIILKYMLVL